VLGGLSKKNAPAIPPMITAGNRVVWIVGRIEYLDGSKRPHQTQVCCRWDRRRGVFIPDEQGNDAD